MVLSLPLRRARKLAAAVATTAALIATVLFAGAGASQAATQEPCDIFAAAGTPCAAAHSTVRALFAA